MLKKFQTTEADSNYAVLRNKWFYHCWRTEIPFVTVHARKKVAEVEWDYIAFPETFDELIESKRTELMAGFQALFETYGNKKTECWNAGVHALFKNVAIDQAEGLAEAMFDLVVEELGLVH